MPATPLVSVKVPPRAILKRFLPVFLVVSLLMLLVIAAIYWQDSLHQQSMLEQESQHILALQQELIELELRAVQSDLLYLSNQSVLSQFLRGEAPARADLEREYRSFIVNKAIYDQIRCLKTNGDELIRVNYHAGDAEIVPPSQLQSKAMRYYYQQALSLQPGEILVSPFDLNVEYERVERPIKPVIRFVTPVADDGGHVQGILVLNYLGARVLAKLKQMSSGFPGQFMLVNENGDYLQAADPRHEWGWLLDHERSFRADYPQAWNQSVRLESNELQVGDNRFRFQRVPLNQTEITSAASATGAPAGSESLILVAYISEAVANAHSRTLLRQLLLMFTCGMAVVGLLTFYWARSAAVRENHETTIAASESRLRTLSMSFLTAQESERRNLSRNLHDDLGQQVTAILLDLRSLQRQGTDGRDMSLLERAIEETDELLASVHSIATRVRPSVLDDLGLRDAVESFLDEFQGRTGIHVRSELRFQRPDIPSTVGENVYRILQEALANVASHARVKEAEVTIHTDQGRIRMTVCDTGIGFDPAEMANSTRLGILGMSERAELLNGRFDLASQPGRGTQLTVSIPLDDLNDKLVDSAGS